MAKNSVTIDNLPPHVNRSFIEKTKLLSDEELSRIYKTPSIASRAQVLTTAPRYEENFNLFGLNQTISYFEEPNNLSTSNVFLEKIAPSLGDDNDNLEKVTSTKTSNSIEEKEREDLLNFINETTQKNEISKLIKGKLSEFSKG
ncbi:MAG: hypothetical protein K1060chlam5_00758 [Candidatus Anoxychlamydiales bacterium]|nr:hypothetical protein [Candidatus Anoxychlamydiales bacterium]